LGCSALGVVTASEAGRVTIALTPPQRCAGCNGACFWYRHRSAETLSLACDSRPPVGSEVDVTLPERYLLLGATLVYGLPLAALLAGAVIGAVWWRSDVGAAAGAALAVAGAALAVIALRRRLEGAVLARLTVRPVERARA
jgi:positive regulator of sigma E activity